VYKEFKRLMDAGVPVPTNQQWREIQIAEATDPTDTSRSYTGNNTLTPKYSLFWNSFPS
jgi:hypothetical protein